MIEENSGRLSSALCRELETEICSLTGAAAARATNSTASALRSLLYSWSVCRGEAVFVPSFVKPYVVFAVLESGATPVFVDCDRETWNMSADKLESAVKKCIKNNELYPRAVIVSDMFGLPFDCTEINSVCAEYGLLLIEEAAAALGAKWQDKSAGTLGDAAVISFRPPLSVSAFADAGAALTDDMQLAKNIKLIVEGGQKVFSSTTGAREAVRRADASAMDCFTAGLLIPQLGSAAEKAEKRRKIAEKLKKAAEGTAVKFQMEKDGVQSAYPAFALCAEDKGSAERMVQAFRESKIECEAVFSKPLCRHAAFKDLGCQTSDVPVGSNLSVCTFMLPCHEELTEEQTERICSAIKMICV